MKKLIILIITQISICSQIVFSQSSGNLDFSFSTDGKTTTGFSGNDAARDIAVQRDGKIVVVGNNGSGSVAVARYMPNGELDLSFSGNGKITIDVNTISGAGSATAHGVAIQSNGKIVIVGTTVSTIGGVSGEAFILRYNTDGTPDNSFSGDGVLVEIGAANSYDIFYDVVLDANNKIIVTGTRFSGGTQVVVRRYNTDGTLDTNFYGSNNGSTNYPLGIARSLKLQSDAKIVIGGERNNDFFVARFNIDGTLDNTFDTDGFTTTPVGTSNDIGNEIAIDEDSKIVLVGKSFTNGFFEVSLVRYNPDGSLDTQFSGDGKVITSVDDGADAGNAVAIQPDGSIIVAGTSHTPSFTYIDLDNITHIVAANNDMLILNYNKSGSLNSNFSSDGKQKVAFEEGQNDDGLAVILQNDGKVVVAGVADETNFNFGICRLHGISGFSTLKNKLYTHFSNTDNFYAAGIAVQADEKIVVVGTSTSSTTQFAIARYNKDGTLDNTFSGDGKLLVSSSILNSGTAYAVAIQADGKILVAGVANNDSNDDFAIIRLLPNGAMDNTFGTNGKKLIDILHNDFCRSMKIRSDGKIVLAGYSVFYDIPIPAKMNNRTMMSEYKHTVVRLNTDGSLDTSFDTDGKVELTGNLGSDEINSLSLFGDKIIITGYELNEFAIAYRLNANGSLDNTFDGDGKLVYEEASTQIFCSASTVQPDGKLILGLSKNGPNSNSVSIKRFNIDGSNDNSFSEPAIHILGDIKIYTVKSLTNGQILFAFHRVYSNNTKKNTLVRLKENGGFDMTLNNELLYEVHEIGYNTTAIVHDIAVGNYDRIYLAGDYSNGANRDLTLEVFLSCKNPLIAFDNSDEFDEVLTTPYSAQKIIASNQILSTAKIEYQAVKSILLNPGFKVNNGAVFIAKIDVGCSYSANPNDP